MNYDTPERTGPTTGIEHLTESETHRLFAADRRRIVLDVLAEATDPVDVEELAVAIATEESDDGAVEETEARRVAIELHHVHLPKMADFGVLDYDADARRVRTDHGF